MIYLMFYCSLSCDYFLLVISSGRKLCECKTHVLHSTGRRRDFRAARSLGTYDLCSCVSHNICGIYGMLLTLDFALKPNVILWPLIKVARLPVLIILYRKWTDV